MNTEQFEYSQSHNAMIYLNQRNFLSKTIEINFCTKIVKFQHRIQIDYLHSLVVVKENCVIYIVDTFKSYNNSSSKSYTIYIISMNVCCFFLHLVFL